MGRQILFSFDNRQKKEAVLLRQPHFPYNGNFLVIIYGNSERCGGSINAGCLACVDV